MGIPAMLSGGDFLFRQIPLDWVLRLPARHIRSTGTHQLSAIGQNFYKPVTTHALLWRKIPTVRKEWT